MNKKTTIQLELNTKEKTITTIVFLLGVLIFSYTAIRAYLLAFTWDESYSYLQYVRNNILFPEKYEMMDANNHLLNTWSTIQLVNLFGVHEFVLRIPSLFAHILFLIYSYKLIKGFDKDG